MIFICGPTTHQFDEYSAVCRCGKANIDLTTPQPQGEPKVCCLVAPCAGVIEKDAEIARLNSELESAQSLLTKRYVELQEALSERAALEAKEKERLEAEYRFKAVSRMLNAKAEECAAYREVAIREVAAAKLHFEQRHGLPFFVVADVDAEARKILSTPSPKESSDPLRCRHGNWRDHCLTCNKDTDTKGAL